MDRPGRVVWVDTDVALGARRGDVDDGFALAALFRAHLAGRIRLAGVSTVFGNTTAACAEACARRIAEVAGVGVEVVAGAEGPGEPSPGAERIADLPEGAEILALGPLTNAVGEDPALPRRVSLRVVGGNLSSRGFMAPFWPFEFNLALDARATRQVVAVPWREVVLYPLDVVSAMRMDAERLRRLAAGSRLGALLAGESSRWLRRARWRHLGRGFPAWDLPAALEAAGAISTPKTEGKFRIRLRPLGGNTVRLQWVNALDLNTAWAGFESLLLEYPRPGPLSASRQEVH